MLTPENFADLQQAFVIVFGHWWLWILAAAVAIGVFIAIGWIWLGLLRWLTKGEQ